MGKRNESSKKNKKKHEEAAKKVPVVEMNEEIMYNNFRKNSTRNNDYS